MTLAQTVRAADGSLSIEAKTYKGTLAGVGEATCTTKNQKLEQEVEHFACVHAQSLRLKRLP